MIELGGRGRGKEQCGLVVSSCCGEWRRAPESKRFRVELFVCRWRHEADGTLKLVNDGQCLSTASSISHNGDTMGYSVVLQLCVSSVSWVQEASTPVVYPSLDDEFLACQSPHYVVSVKQHKHTSVFRVFCWLAETVVCFQCTSPLTV